MLEAIYWRGIHAVGVYEFAEGIGEFVHGTANPSTTFGGPPPFDKGGFAQKPSSPTILTYTNDKNARTAVRAFSLSKKTVIIMKGRIAYSWPPPPRREARGFPYQFQAVSVYSTVTSPTGLGRTIQ